MLSSKVRLLLIYTLSPVPREIRVDLNQLWCAAIWCGHQMVRRSASELLTQLEQWRGVADTMLYYIRPNS